MKRLLLLGIAIIGLLPYGRAGVLKADKTFVALHIPIDSVDVKTVLNNVFLASVMGSNGARLNPKAVNYVQDFMIHNKQELDEIKSWGQPYFKVIDGILNQYGLPLELKYLAVIESNLKATALSPVGALGPWQLMPATARILGLKVNHKVDERKNYYKSTKAAAIYLRDLYTELGDWLLVIAAYNGGTGNVYRAIRKSNSHDFWHLQNYLPAESRNHVKKFIGTEYTFEGQGSVTTLTRDEATKQLSGSAMYVFSRKLTREELDGSKTITVTGKYFSSVISRNVLMDETEFNRYNPNFDKVMASANNSYELKLPADKMDLFVSNKYEILNESVERLALSDAANSENKTFASITRK
ncbi:MAG TPA: lytic transglycosylase domain-containing protein [Puia sp.]|jgi:membrane-bound lytic murein transglycosylase D|nr:lytic transglycosylase domain-containing protein [Puia sp.]